MKKIYIGGAKYQIEIKRLFCKSKLEFRTDWITQLFFEENINEVYKKLEKSQELYEKEYYGDWDGNPKKILNRELLAECKDDLYSFERLQSKMTAEDFLEFCKQGLYPIDIIIK